MTEYVIEGTEKPKEKPVKVCLKKYTDRIHLYVGGWIVFDLNSNGTGYVVKGIPEDNEAGLQVDSDGRIVLE